MFRKKPQSGALVPVVNAAITTMLYMPRTSFKVARVKLNNVKKQREQVAVLYGTLLIWGK
jgi:hypothetical protein